MPTPAGSRYKMANWAKLQEDTHDMPVFKRAKHGIHFKRPDGQIQAEFCGKPCHYLDGGIYKPIDTKLLLGGDGFYGCPHSPVRVHTDGHVKVDGSDYAQYVQLPSASGGLVDGDRIIRQFSFGEQRLWVTEDGFRSEITLNRIPTLTEARKLVATESGTLSKEYIKSLTTATDANGATHTFSTLSAFRTWLASAVFPVVIDPDFAGASDSLQLYSNTDTWTNARNTSAACQPYGTAYKYFGIYDKTDPNWMIYRGLHKFDTSSIGASSTVTQVNFKATSINLYTSADYDLLLVKYNWSTLGADYTNATNQEIAYDALLTADLDDNPLCNRLDMTVNTPITSGNLNTAWINKTGTTYYGMIVENDRNNSEPAHGNNYMHRFCGAIYTTEAYRPVLSVTYTAGGNPHYLSLLGVGK